MQGKFPRFHRVQNAVSGATTRLANSVTLSSVSSVGTSIGNAAQQLQAIPNTLAGKVFPECYVPVFLVPTGPGTRDFQINFDFTAEIDALRSGLLARPVLKIWTGRTDFDRDWFAEQFQREFMKQFDQARQAVADSYESELAIVAAKRTKAAGDFGKESIRAIRNTLFVFVGVPLLLDFVFLNWAVDSTTRSVKLLAEIIRLGAEERGTKRERQTKLKEIESQFARREKAIQRAIKRLAVVPHPQLEAIAALFGIEELPADPEPTAMDFPDIRTALDLARYRAMFAGQDKERFDAAVTI